MLINKKSKLIFSQQIYRCLNIRGLTSPQVFQTALPYKGIPAVQEVLGQAKDEELVKVAILNKRKADGVLGTNC